MREQRTGTNRQPATAMTVCDWRKTTTVLYYRPGVGVASCVSVRAAGSRGARICRVRVKSHIHI
eukprot:scaffold28228_cov111-Isochrysis_galbana.AAC.4